jgi:hypothetical protein
MNLDDKCLLVLKPSEALYHWLTSILEASQQELRSDFKRQADDPVEVSLEEMQADASCYLMPSFPPNETAAYLEKHMADIFRAELSTWCPVEAVWPPLNFATFVSSFKFDFYFDWMNFKKEELLETQQDMQNVVLLIKPAEPFKDYLRNLLTEKCKLPAAMLDQALELRFIQNGSTAVITDVYSLENLETFLEQHSEEIFRHQLLLWGGEETQDFWPGDLGFQMFRQWFSVEIHRHTYFMLH